MGYSRVPAPPARMIPFRVVLSCRSVIPLSPLLPGFGSVRSILPECALEIDRAYGRPLPPNDPGGCRPALDPSSGGGDQKEKEAAEENPDFCPEKETARIETW